MNYSVNGRIFYALDKLLVNRPLSHSLDNLSSKWAGANGSENLYTYSRPPDTGLIRFQE